MECQNGLCTMPPDVCLMSQDLLKMKNIVPTSQDISHKTSQDVLKNRVPTSQDISAKTSQDVSEYVSRHFSRRLEGKRSNVSRHTIQDVLRRLEDVLMKIKTCLETCLKDIFFQDVLWHETSWRRLKTCFETSSRHLLRRLQDVLESQDVSRHLKTCPKTSSRHVLRRLQDVLEKDVFKTCL